MLPDELIVQVIQHLDLEDLVSLSFTNTQWRDCIPESLYEQKLRRHCPSFLPHNTSRKSWQECARVHVARLKDPNLKKRLESEMRGGERVRLNVTKNEPPPDGFVSFLDLLDSSENGHRDTSVEIFPGHYLTTFHGYTATSIHRDIRITQSDLTTTSGCKLDTSVLGDSEPNATRVVKSDHSIAVTTSKRVSKDEGTCQVAFKISAKEDMLVYSATDESHEGRMYAFVGDKFASAACYRPYNDLNPRPESDPHPESESEDDEYHPSPEYVSPLGAKMSFMTVQGDEIEHCDYSFDVPESEHLDDIFAWCDGLLLEIVTSGGNHVKAWFYDLERKTHVLSGMLAYGCYLNSFNCLEGRYICFNDMNMEVRTVWDLKTNTQHYIEIEDRDYFSLVGLLDGKLKVYTYDWNYMSKILPANERPGRKSRLPDEALEKDERSIFQNVSNNSSYAD